MACTFKNNAASEAIAKLYLNEELADVRYLFNVNKEIQIVSANRAILAALSPVFKPMLFGELKEKEIIELVDTTAAAFREFLQFFYLGEVTLTMENMEEVVRLADKYDIMDHINNYVAFPESKIKPYSMCWAYQLALYMLNPDFHYSSKNRTLIDFCEEKICQNPKEVFASDAFRRCEGDTLAHILRLPLTCTEIIVFNACIEWAKNACKQEGLDENQLKNVRSQLGDHFKLIRFGAMTIDEFLNIQKSHEGLFTPEELQDIMLQLANTEYQSNIFEQSPRTYTWDDSKILDCQRVKVSGRKYNKKIQSVEVVSFSSNQPVLLGEIWSHLTYQNNTVCTPFGVNVTIVQLEDNNFHSNASSKILFDGKELNQWEGNQMKIVLPKPILIKPQTVNEIRITKIPSSCNYFDYNVWNECVTLENGIEIYFHQNPSLEYDNVTDGWISALKFNQAKFVKKLYS